MALTSSMEDYLEAVLILHQKHGSVRGVDIAVYMGVTKPSVSRAVKELTDSRQAMAEKIYERHCFFTKYLTEMGVDPKLAESDACKLEHVISETSYKKLREAAWPSSREVIPSDE